MRTLNILTEKEFDIVVNAIIYQDQNDELVYGILKRLVSPTLRRYCAPGRLLNGQEDDLFHEICIRLMKKFVPAFWSKHGENADTAALAQYFCRWLRTLARNYCNDQYRKALLLRSPLMSLEDLGTELSESDSKKLEELAEKRELLTYAFSIVLDASNDVHIILTWLGMSLLILVNDKDRIRINQSFIDTASHKSLYELRDLLYRCADSIDWMVISDDQKAKIDTRLDAACPDGRKMGQRLYSEFYMERDPKAAISDWYYRMNRKIQKVIENETYNS